MGFWILTVSGALLLIWHAWYYFPYIVDDSFISFRYGERLLQGKGLTWNEGKPVEGYSNLLWILLLSLGESITHWPWWFLAFALALTCSLLSLYLTLSLVNRLSGGYLPAVGCAMGLFAGSPPLGVWINGGLEVTLVMLLIIAALSFLLRAAVGPREIVFSGVCLGLLCLTRPDGFVPGCSIIFSYAVFYRRRKQALLLAVIMSSFYAGQLIFRLGYYGEWISNSAMAKLGFSWRRWKEGVIYVKNFLFPYLPFLLLLIYCFRTLQQQRKPVILLLLTIIAVDTVYISAVGGDNFLGFRLVVPLLPVICLAAAITMQETAAKWNLLKKPVLLAVMVVAGSWLMFWYQRRYPANRSPKLDDGAWNLLAIGASLRAGFPAQTKVATGAASALPFSSGLPTLDLLGLNDSWLTHHKPAGFGSGRLAHELGDVNYYLREQPDIVVFTGDFFSLPWLPQEKALMNHPAFRAGYLAVNAVCARNYPLPFPVYGFPDSTSVRIRDTVTLYIREHSPNTGLLFTGENQGKVPVYFLQNATGSTRARIFYAGRDGTWVTDLQPGESGILRKHIFPGAPSKSNNLTITALTASGDSLSTAVSGDTIRITNKTGSVRVLAGIYFLRGTASPNAGGLFPE